MDRTARALAALLLALALTALPQAAAEGDSLPSPSPAAPSAAPTSQPPSTTPDPAPTPSSLPSASPSPTLTPGPTAEGKGSIFDLLQDTGESLEIDMAAYYLQAMVEAAKTGDVEAGRQAQEDRDGVIDRYATGEEKISFDELYLLARMLQAEAGSDWLSQDFRLCVGEVALNRVASPEFPDTLREVIYQKGQYACALSPGFESLVPGEKCVDAALTLLQGHRQMVPAVVFQSSQEQGEIFSVYTDRRLGSTFFCLSPNLELYE